MAKVNKAAAQRGGPFFEDVFTVKDLDKDGQKFHNVSRVYAANETGAIDVVMDVQCELYRLKTKEKFTIALAYTLSLDGKPDDGTWTPSNEPNLLDKYDYGMYGKVYRVENVSAQKTAVYVSHGGLLMKMVGENKALQDIAIDKRVYTLLKRA